MRRLAGCLRFIQRGCCSDYVTGRPGGWREVAGKDCKQGMEIEERQKGLSMSNGLEYFKSVTAEEFIKDVSSEDNRKFVTETMEKLTADPIWSERIISEIGKGHIETRCFVAWLAKTIQPATYLEIGVRRGFSMAMVAAQCSEAEIFGFDMWVKGYGGVLNPGPKFVQSEMIKVGYEKRVNLIGGNSHDTVTPFFRGRKPALLDRIKGVKAYHGKPDTVDLIVVDGDHSLLGAYWDLLDVLPYCSLGGAVVFDDIAPDNSEQSEEIVRRERGEDPCGWGDLFGVWQAVKRLFGCFIFFDYVDNPPGVGIAIRMK